MSKEKDIQYIIKRYGIEILLEESSKYIEEKLMPILDKKYLEKLKEDIDIAIKNYKNRYNKY
jgi:uncharacterized protein (UPF0276 family)